MSFTKIKGRFKEIFKFQNILEGKISLLSALKIFAWQ